MFVKKLGMARNALAQIVISPKAGTKGDRYDSVVLLKHVISVATAALKKLEPELRADAEAATTPGSSKTAAWKEHAIGDIAALQYDAKPGDPVLKATLDDVKNLIRGKRNVNLAQVIKTTESVDVGALVALVETGHLTQAELDGLIARPEKKGSFTVDVRGTTAELMDWDDTTLQTYLAEADEKGTDIAGFGSRASNGL